MSIRYKIFGAFILVIALACGLAFYGTALASLMGSRQPFSVNRNYDPTVRANVLSQQGKINNDLAPFKFYPVMSIGFAYSF
jgi:hypothetical protein